MTKLTNDDVGVFKVVRWGADWRPYWVSFSSKGELFWDNGPCSQLFEEARLYAVKQLCV